MHHSASFNFACPQGVPQRTGRTSLRSFYPLSDILAVREMPGLCFTIPFARCTCFHCVSSPVPRPRPSLRAYNQHLVKLWLNVNLHAQVCVYSTDCKIYLLWKRYVFYIVVCCFLCSSCCLSLTSLNRCSHLSSDHLGLCMINVIHLLAPLSVAFATDRWMWRHCCRIQILHWSNKILWQSTLLRPKPIQRAIGSIDF